MWSPAPVYFSAGRDAFLSLLLDVSDEDKEKAIKVINLLQPLQLAVYFAVIDQGGTHLDVALKQNLAKPSHCENTRTSTSCGTDGQIPPAANVLPIVG